MMKSWMLEIVNQLLEERDTLLDFKDNCELERK